MRPITRCLPVVLLLLGFVLPAHGTATRIMPLGDSITSGANTATYRFWLWYDLLENGFNVDFVGSQVGTYGGGLYPDFDQDHEGHGGWTADQILAHIGAWAETYQPQMVLVHLGTNDLYLGQSIASTLAELGMIIDELRVANPTVHVLLAQIIPATGWFADSIPVFNAQIPALARSTHTAESPVLVVDQFTGFDPDEDTSDGVHPNESGELKMSARWLEVLWILLPDPAALEWEPIQAHSRAWPSPSLQEVWFSWDLQHPDEVHLSVYDASGRRVAVLAERAMASGSHTMKWDGRGVPAGVYYVQLTTGKVVSRSRVLLMR